MSGRPSDLATDTRWCPSRTKYRSPILNSETGGIDSPRRCAAAMRSQRLRRRGEGGGEAGAEATGGAAEEPAAEVDGATARADDRLQRHHLEPQVVLANAPERLHDLLEGQDQP